MRIPTEGSMRLREYAAGDDARRIHWVRSLAAGELVVRLPDELPPALPSVQLVLDTFFPGAEDFACDGPAELLDTLVRVWLGLGQRLAELGTPVTLVTAIEKKSRTVRVEQALSRRAGQSPLRLGALVKWQDERSVLTILEEKTPSIVVSCWPLWARLGDSDARLVLVRARTGTIGEVRPHFGPFRVQFPAGSPDNRWGRRRQERNRLELARRDHATFRDLTTGAEPRKGTLFVRSTRGGEVRLEALE